MSRYTIQLKQICESLSDINGHGVYNDVDQIIEQSYKKIFSFDYNFYDENQKEYFEKTFIKYFYTEEICCETFGEWKLYLESWIHVNIDYWNHRLKSVKLDFDPLNTIDVTTNVTTNNGINSQSTLTGNDWSLFNDTPQGGLTGVKDNKYLTTAQNNQTDQTTTSNANENSNGVTTETGRRENPSKLILDYQKAVKNVYNEMFNEMSKLFFGLWG